MAIPVTALKGRGQRGVTLLRESALGARTVSAFDIRAIEADLRTQVTQSRAFLTRQMPIARQMVSRLLYGTRITVDARSRDQQLHLPRGRRCWTARERGAQDYARGYVPNGIRNR